jgi:hypothetical protein
MYSNPQLPEGACFFRKPYSSDQMVSTLRELVT